MGDDEATMADAIRAAGHQPRLTEAGSVDFWAFEDSPDDAPEIVHAGPQCTVCGDRWCASCWRNGWETIGPCRGADEGDAE